MCAAPEGTPWDVYREIHKANAVRIGDGDDDGRRHGGGPAGGGAPPRRRVPPPEMCVFIKYMVPSMNFAERLDMLGGMYQGVPPEIFEMFQAATEACLPTDE